ncbi:carboxyl transferase domain-containing protein [Streptomyces kanamyceticus]|uniref:Acetyl-coenzyme A carboxylase carboxyl transferase subunit alpha n=1 Tax=Streptomyces kanamyceticus TaxID=1967 RepID=A0A5J6G9Q6_STRKN|nr:carboxyl transferase domain-containing protein [Streptomyces kanamyceticus]QEU89966.1 acetyl-CoA carboxylase carboxyl transferase subunit beta [Streptomyces kanamyceticus]
MKAGEQLFDAGSLKPLGARPRTGDPLVCAEGAVHGHRVVAAVTDFRLLGELIATAAERAVRERLPLLVVAVSGGAGTQEVTVSPTQLARAAQALGELDREGILTLAVISDPPYGEGVASIAGLFDVIVAESGSGSDWDSELPDGSRTAEYLRERGLVDVLRPRAELRDTLARLLATAAVPASPAVRAEGTGAPSARAPLIRDPAELPESAVKETVRRARHLGRPTTLDYFGRLFTGFEELRGDRGGSDCPSIVGGPARLDGVPVMVLGHQKGHPGEAPRERGFGTTTPAGHRKAARLLRLAGKLGLPVITLVDTPGTFPGLETGEQGQGQAVVIAESIRLMTGLPVPVVTLVTGEGGSGGALALAVADRVLVCANCVYSVISPEGCAALLWDDAATAPGTAEALRIDAGALLRLGIADAVVPEPADGAHTDPALAADYVHAALASVLDELRPMPVADLVAARYDRFRAYGAVESFMNATEEAMQS